MKKLISLILAGIMLFSLAACSTANNESSIPENTGGAETVSKLDVNCNVYAIKGPTGVGMVSLMDKAKKGDAGLNYNFNLVGDNTEIIAKISSGEANIAAVATNVASTLYNKTNGGISVLAINTLGVLTLIAKGEEISSIADLKGKTVYSTGQGANPEYILNYVLEKNGLKAGEDIKIEFVSQPQELVAKVTTSDKAIAVAPQPVATNITVKDTAAKIVLDMNDEWAKVSDTDLVMGCIIARNDFINENPEAVKLFLKEYKASIEAVNSDVASAATLCAEYEIVSPAPVAQKAIPYCHIVYQDGKELKTNLSAYLKFLFDRNPQSIGGTLPADGFYYGAN